MCQQPLSDDEVVCRRIPPNEPWFEPPDQVSSANFKLDARTGERGLSVYRLSVVSAQQVLEKPGAIPGSMVAAARVGDIRKLVSGAENSLHLEVVAVDDENDPGHAEIRGPQPGVLAPAASKALKKVFKRLSDSI